MRVLVHIVCFNSAHHISRCLDALRAQEGMTIGSDFEVHVTDNASSDLAAHQLKALVSLGVEVFQNTSNLGFCGAHNQGVRRFLSGPYELLLILNPDLYLASTALAALVNRIDCDEKVGCATPLLLRADEDLNPISPEMVDAAGMHLTAELRHFDRGSGEVMSDEYESECYVFGGSGACLLLKRKYIQELIVEGAGFEKDVDNVYPQLREGRNSRDLLFDEAFFAYREDADLAWRGQRLGWRCLYVPTAKGYHRRLVTPERRHRLAPEINLFGVRNRFLLQLNNLTWGVGFWPIVLGVIIRNVAVILATVLIERKSLPAFRQVFTLFRRARERRRMIQRRIEEKVIAGEPNYFWFKNRSLSPDRPAK